MSDLKAFLEPTIKRIVSGFITEEDPQPKLMTVVKTSDGRRLITQPIGHLFTPDFKVLIAPMAMIMCRFTDIDIEAIGIMSESYFATATSVKERDDLLSKYGAVSKFPPEKIKEGIFVGLDDGEFNYAATFFREEQENGSITITNELGELSCIPSSDANFASAAFNSLKFKSMVLDDKNDSEIFNYLAEQGFTQRSASITHSLAYEFKEKLLLLSGQKLINEYSKTTNQPH